MYKSSYTGSQIDEAVAKANAAAPQSTTYTKTEVDSALSGKQATLVVDTNLDSAPTENSTNPVTSGGVYQALSGKSDASHTHTMSQITDLGAAAAKGFDETPTSGHTDYAVSSDGVANALNNMKWNYQSAVTSTVNADVWEYTGLSVNVPANTERIIVASDRSSYTTGIIIADNNTNIGTNNSIIGATIQNLADLPAAPWMMSAQAITPKYNSELNFYVWVRRNNVVSGVITSVADALIS